MAASPDLVGLLNSPSRLVQQPFWATGSSLQLSKATGLLGCWWLPNGLAGSAPAPDERPEGSASTCPPRRPCSPAPTSSWLQFSAAARKSFCPCRLQQGASFGAPRQSSHLNHQNPLPSSGTLACQGPSTTPVFGMMSSRRPSSRLH